VQNKNMTSTINWGILAPGRIAHKFAHDLGLAKNARLHAVASRSLERATGFANKYRASHAFGSYGEMVACPDLDVVYVASPHSFHLEHSLLLLKNNIPVVCEKPLAINSAQVQQLVSAARSNNTFLMEAIWTRFNPMFRKTMELVDSGVIGQLNTLRSDFGFKAKFDPDGRLFNPALGGGSLLDVGLYPVYAATQFLGRPSAIKAVARKGPTGTDDACAMLFDYPGGELAILDSSVINNTRTAAVLYGEKGKVEIHTRFHEGERATVSIFGEKEEEIYLPKTGNGYFHEIVAVNDCLLNGQKECKELPLDFSLLMMENLDAVRKEAGIFYPDFD